MTVTKQSTFAARQLAVVLTLAAIAITNVSVARAIEIIPSVGITKSTDENAADAQGFGGLAIRFPVLPFLKLEGGVGYRQDSFADGDLKVHQWPLTASAWASPFPMLYGGGGLGWYETTYDYASDLPIKDTTEMTMGVHLGGGLNVPIGPRLVRDLREIRRPRARHVPDKASDAEGPTESLDPHAGRRQEGSGRRSHALITAHPGDPRRRPHAPAPRDREADRHL